ncbi:MAG: hypothetical protein J0L92_25570 [Deltaproteobacteria bacterium]|nr:hypothetical protein [Deltaproteobacteria bacterium]
MSAWAAFTPIEREDHVRDWVSKLGVELGRQLHIDAAHADRIDDRYFSVDVRDVGETVDRVRASVFAHELDGGLHIRSFVFYYLGGKRVGPDGNEYVVYAVRPADDTWQFCSWQRGHWGEFDAFENY